VAHGVMTPHLDLAMAAALLAGVLAWAVKHEAATLVAWAISLQVKFVTALLAPAIVVGLAAAGVGRGPRRRELLWAVPAVGVVLALLWPRVWEPFVRHGMPRSLEMSSAAALLPNVITALQASELLVLTPAPDPLAVAKSLRWVVFVPFWLGGTVLCVLLARHRARELPHVLLEPLALLLLGYHVLFTVLVLPWHFITALCLCLVSASRAGVLAALLVTSSSVLVDVNHQWVWTYLWPHHRWVEWVLGLTQLTGPIIAMVVLLRAAWGQYRMGLDSAAPPA
jgi:hypothetical protein